MYNADFLPQIKKFRRDVFGDEEYNRGGAPRRYVLPPNVKVLECKEDINGEYVPFPATSKKTLEERTEE